MFWIYVLAGTLGVVTLVPTVLRALDGEPGDQVVGAIGFGATVFAATGYLLQQFDLGNTTALVAALALGAATATVHPEILSALGGTTTQSSTTQSITQGRTDETCPAPFADEAI